VLASCSLDWIGWIIFPPNVPVGNYNGRDARLNRGRKVKGDLPMGKVGWLVVMLSLVLVLPAAAETLSVAVKAGALRTTPQIFAPIVATLAYAERVDVLERKGAWVRVRAGSKGAGWLHASALSSKKLALKAGQGTVRSTASEDELTLAGKGFNAQVEKEFRQRNRTLDFSAIDRMEGLTAAPAEVQRFLREGQLAAGGQP